MQWAWLAHLWGVRRSVSVQCRRASWVGDSGWADRLGPPAERHGAVAPIARQQRCG